MDDKEARRREQERPEVRLRIKEVQMSDMYPFTNCTMDPNAIEPELCETECIQKTIAERCCDSSIDPLAGLTTDRIASDPMLVCPLGVTEEVEQCIRQVKRDSHNGQVCKHPENLSTARGDRFGWYDATSEAQKKLVEEKVLAGESRLYCPSLCNKQTFEPVYTTSGTSLTEGAALAIASQLVYEKPAKVEKMTKQTGCAESPDECIALTVSYVKKNFAVVHVLYDSFEIETVQITPAMSAFSLFGAIGGNLGMWVGVSMMTILESMEWLLVAAAAGLCCVGCCAAKRRPSSSDNMPPSELRSATIMYAQPPAMVHPPLPMGSVRGVSTSSQFGV
ncbi:hypothetical protein T484DRAFT_1850197 [Baffinella frigidus]|nr:hypothetical protein T484DRAFT_1850197 [Cryptophyta sp. CCMP2293]